MKRILIQDKLAALGIDTSSIILGDFDAIGKFTAERTRDRNDPNFAKYGFTYRSNYERGILLYFLIRCYDIRSVLEIGFGRGYSALCAAKAFHDAGVNGKVTTVDPTYDENHVRMLSQFFPKEWLNSISFQQGRSDTVVPSLPQHMFDLVLIDGDHSYEGTKVDWLNTRERFAKVMVFDDYHMASKNDPGIQCARLIDEIDVEAEGCEEKELCVMDRRLFVDDRRLTDDQVNYGQVILTRKGLNDAEW